MIERARMAFEFECWLERIELYLAATEALLAQVTHGDFGENLLYPAQISVIAFGTATVNVHCGQI